MKLFIDTADINEIKEANAMGVIDGVTTNPSLIAKTGRDFKSPQVWDSNFCIELYFKTPSRNCILVRKMTDIGYGLNIDDAGRLRFQVKGPGGTSGDR